MAKMFNQIVCKRDFFELLIFTIINKMLEYFWTIKYPVKIYFVFTIF